jgi:protein gp37
MGKTSIEWTGVSVNPIKAMNTETGQRGHVCTGVGPECDHCYAESYQSWRGTHLPYKASTLELVELEFREDVLDEVRKLKQPTKIFWFDMTDVFLANYSR